VSDGLAAVVVVNWNGRHYLEGCLAALRVQTLPELQIVVVDNGSTDGSAALVRSAFPEVQLIPLAENRGFAAGNNAGIRGLRTRYVLALNNDTIAEPGWAEALVAAAEGDAGVGAVASRIVFADRPEVLDAAGLAAAWDGNGYNIGLGEPATEHLEPREVFGACAGAALYRRAMLDDVGLFDERYFAYVEDTDLAWRAQLAGWRCLYAPDAVVRHVHSGTGGRSERKRYLLQRNRCWTLAKDWPLGLLVRGLPWIVWRDLGSLAYTLFAQRSLASVRARLAALAGLPAVLAERRRIQARRRQSNAELAALLVRPPSLRASLATERLLAARASAGAQAASAGRAGE
jgi:GT2 family glycosyltransferase